jgi:hypothetical protein
MYSIRSYCTWWWTTSSHIFSAWQGYQQTLETHGDQRWQEGLGRPTFSTTALQNLYMTSMDVDQTCVEPWIVILCISGGSICKHPHSSSALLNWWETGQSDNIFLHHQVGVVVLRTMHQLHKQLVVHPKVVPNSSESYKKWMGCGRGLKPARGEEAGG